MTINGPLVEHEFVASDGLRLHYRILPGHGVPLVLHHGFATTADAEWVDRGIVALLRDAGRPLVILDARGHGGSDAPHDPASYGEKRLAADLIELATHVGGPVDVLGYSMGAIITLLAASWSPSLIRRFAVGGIGSGVVEVGGLDSRVLDTDLLASVFRGDVDDSDAPDLSMWRESARALGADVVALAAVAASLQIDGVDLDAIVQAPLVFAGASDFLADRPEILARAIPNASLLVVPGDHGTTLDHPLVRASLLAFVASDNVAKA